MFHHSLSVRFLLLTAYFYLPLPPLPLLVHLRLTYKNEDDGLQRLALEHVGSKGHNEAVNLAPSHRTQATSPGTLCTRLELQQGDFSCARATDGSGVVTSHPGHSTGASSPSN